MRKTDERGPAVPLEPTGDELEKLLAGAIEYVTSVLARMPSTPASDLDGVPDFLADEALHRLPAADGRALDEVLAVVDHAATKGLNTASPGYFAFIPGSGIVAAAIADLIADVLNRYTAFAFPAPGLVALENSVLRWMVDLFGLPPTAGGLLTTGASMAAFSAVVTARSTRLPDDFRAGTMYVTDQAHLATAKAARLAGFPADAVRMVAVDADLRMDLAALRAAIAADRAAGRIPFCVVASAGTIHTGTVDPLHAIADVAAEEGLWLHVDAAYGGFFQLTERGAARLAGIERADSLMLDAHKGLFLPFGTGALLVRDAALLRQSHTAQEAVYLQDLGSGGLPDFANDGPELTRDFRGLRMWLPLHLHGVDAFRAALDDKLDLAEYVYEELRAEPGLVVRPAPELSTVAFTCREDQSGGATAELLRRVNAEQRAFLSSSRIDGRYVARICVLNHRTDRARVTEVIDAVRRHVAIVERGG